VTNSSIHEALQIRNCNLICLLKSFVIDIGKLDLRWRAMN